MNVQLCHREVQEGASHASVLPLINSITIFILIQHRCHAELLN
jgi:hypothetical protein